MRSYDHFKLFVLNGLVTMMILFLYWVFALSLLLLQLTNDNRQLIFLYERGKKKLMDGARIAFTGNVHFNCHDDLVHCVVSLFVSLSAEDFFKKFQTYSGLLSCNDILFVYFTIFC